ARRRLRRPRSSTGDRAGTGIAQARAGGRLDSASAVYNDARADRRRASGEPPMMDKDEFKKKLGEFFQESKVKAVRKLEPDMVVVCTLARDFDPKSNDLWDQWGNK